MTVCCGLGTSRHRNAKVAAQDAANMALQSLNGQTPDLVLLFASIGYDQTALVRTVWEACGKVPLCGCSAEGVINGNWTDESPFAVSLLLIHDTERKYHVHFTSGLDDDSESCAKTMVEDVLRQSPEAKALLIFPDGVCINTTRFLRGIQVGLGSQTLPIIGGAAGDDWRMEQCYQYCGGDVHSRGVSWCSIEGGEKPVWAMSHGCVPLAGESVITRAEGNHIFEIDGIPVNEFLDSHMAHTGTDWRNESVNIAIAYPSPADIIDAQPSELWQITHVVTSDEHRKRGYIVIQPELAVGTVIQLARRDPVVIRNGLVHLADEIKDKLGGRAPSFLLQFDCAGRGRVVFQESQREINLRMLQEDCLAGVPWIGFYTYGEFMPIAGQNVAQNYTAVLVAFP